MGLANCSSRNVRWLGAVLLAGLCFAALPVIGGGSVASARVETCARSRGSATPVELLALAKCQQQQGMTEEAVALLQRGLSLPQTQADPALHAAFASELGAMFLRLGAATEAKASLSEALAALPTGERSDRRVQVLLDLGAAYALSDEFPRAADVFGQAALLAEAADDRDALISAQLARARAELDAGQPAVAQASLDEVWQEMQAPPGRSRTNAHLLALGELYQRVDADSGKPRNTAHALQMLTEAGEQARRERDVRAESFALGYLGALAERYGELPKALDYSRLAVARAQEAVALDGLYQWQWQSARVLARMGQTALAIEAYQQAIVTLSAIRPELARGSSRNFQKAVAPVFFGMANLLLQSPGANTSAAAEVANLRLVRSTIEELKIAEIQDYFDNECVVNSEQPAPLDELSANAAVIYPIIFDDRLEVLTSRGPNIRRHTAAVDRQTLTRTVREFRLNLERRPTHRYREPGRKLYDWLVGPVVEELRAQKVSTLIFVPDGPLRSIPPAALYDGSRFLVEDFAVATTLGLTLTSPRPIPRKSATMLAGGLTVGVEGFSPLPGVATELAEIARLYPARELRDEKFEVTPVTEELAVGDYSVVHIATHGQFKPDFRQSFLLAYDGRISLDLLEQTVGQRRYHTQPVELLMLSACETAAGDDRAALGLAGVALKAGARSAVATLWAVYDEATATLVGQFYEGLQDPSLSKAEALRQAQLKLLKDQRYAHPAVWSPFLLIGNWL